MLIAVANTTTTVAQSGDFYRALIITGLTVLLAPAIIAFLRDRRNGKRLEQDKRDAAILREQDKAYHATLRKEDNARQDALILEAEHRQDVVAARVEVVAAEARQAATQAQHTAADARLQMTQIHTLVNSEMTGALSQLLKSLEVHLYDVGRVIKLTQDHGMDPTPEDLIDLAQTQERVNSLRGNLADRLAQQRLVELEAKRAEEETGRKAKVTGGLEDSPGKGQ